MKHKNNNFKNIIISVIFVLILIIILCFWLYSGKLSELKIRILNSFPFPMAVVNGNFIPMSQYTFRYNVNAKVLGTEYKNSSDEIIRPNIYNALIQEAIINELAKKTNVSISLKEIDEEYNFRVNQTNTEGKKDFPTLLSSYGLNEKFYKQDIIKPYLLQNKLQVWFNNNQNLNIKPYKNAKLILDQIKSGQDIKYLAKNYSEDELEKSVYGDLGFLDVSELIPEFKEPISTMQLGDVKIIGSRYGLHVIKIEEIVSNKVHIRQIFIKTESFEDWKNSESKKIKIIKLINI